MNARYLISNYLFLFEHWDTWPMLSGLFQALCFCAITRGVVLGLDGKCQSQWNHRSYHRRW